MSGDDDKCHAIAASKHLEEIKLGLVYSSKYVQGQIGHYDVMEAIKKCLSRIDGGHAGTAITRWFGDNSAASVRAIRKDLNKFRSVLNLQEITVGFFDLNERAQGQNAAALPGSASSIDPSTMTNYKGRQVLLDEAFNRLPNYLPEAVGVIDNSDWHQSKFNTLVHELSHAILATNDEDLTDASIDGYNGTTAYGAQRASALAVEDSTKAKTNAENWGIFIEACGVNESS